MIDINFENVRIGARFTIKQLNFHGEIFYVKTSNNFSLFGHNARHSISDDDVALVKSGNAIKEWAMGWNVKRGEIVQVRGIEDVSSTDGI